MPNFVEQSKVSTPLPAKPYVPSSKKKQKTVISRSAVFALFVFLALVLGIAYLKISIETTASPAEIQGTAHKIPVKKVDWNAMLFTTDQFTSLQANTVAPLDTDVGQGNPAPFEKKKK